MRTVAPAGGEFKPHEPPETTAHFAPSIPTCAEVRTRLARVIGRLGDALSGVDAAAMYLADVGQTDLATDAARLRERIARRHARFADVLEGGSE